MSETATNDTTPKDVETKDQKNGDQNGEEEKDKTQTPPVKEMRAIVLTGFGGLKSVKVMKRPEPTLSEGEVLIRVKACGLNFPDLMLRQGVIDNPPKTKAPFIMGFECAGEIEAVGEGVTGFRVGDRVAALSEAKAWAELVAINTKYVYKIPAKMSFQDAVATTMNYVVAYALLFGVGNLKSDQTVLVHSVGGGVGQAVAQLAKTVGNVTLIGTATKAKHESIQNVTHLIDHTNDYIQEIKKVAPDGVDLVLDCLCGDDANKGYSLLKPMGRYILYGASKLTTGETKSLFSLAKFWWQVDKVSPMKLFDENKTIAGFNLRQLLYQQGRDEYVRDIVDNVYKLYSEGQIKPVVDSTWALEDIADAMQKLHDRKNIGKVVLDPSQEPIPRPPEEVIEKKRKGSAKEKETKDKDKEKDKENKESKDKVENSDSTEKAPENGDNSK
ncbi:synaptic vesicle membrane protein VAT-1 homolog-like isoform X2 [Oppia nitens]|uniref:synaptic vesicle membrane protein VAT-1 homolog-like isoform X2 n=1 Tax=Oppia nitens TaxID=1686743 RepID=UPI0023D9F841|nr:synaptic vesicle membrane protein VAT-1 homolog-like isoform X2 [Oppia nitens]